MSQPNDTIVVHLTQAAIDKIARPFSGRAVAIEAEYRRNLDQSEERRKEQRRQLEADCPHVEWKHYPDAAGGSDSFDRCTGCGKERR